MDNQLLVLGLIAFGLFLSGCTIPNTPTNEKGVLTGHISIGPLCPVERIPPDPNCQATLQTYQAYPLSVYNSSNQKIAEFTGDATGNYRIELLEGTYTIKSEQGIRGYSQTTQIKAGQSTTQDIDIDTGIR